MTFANTGLSYTTPLSIESEERVFRSDSLSLKVQAVSRGTQRWVLEIGLEPTRLGGSGGETALLAVHRASHGQHTPFNTLMPQHLGTEDVGVTVSARLAALAGATTIHVNASSTFPANLGRFITFAGSTKLHQIVAATALTAPNRRTLTVFPALVANVAASAAVSFSPQIRVYYAQNGQEGLQYTNGILQRSNVALVEAI